MQTCLQLPGRNRLYGAVKFPSPISDFLPTCAQAIPFLRSERHPPCALLGISSDICAGNPPSKPYFQLSLHTSQPLNRHLRRQTLTHALSGNLSAHMYSLCHSERPFVILSASEESVSSPPIFSSSPFTRHLRRQSLFHAVFSTFPAHISTPKPTCAMANLDTRSEWHTPCALPGISHDICADNPPPTPYFQLFLRTSRHT